MQETWTAGTYMLYAELAIARKMYQKAIVINCNRKNRRMARALLASALLLLMLQWVPPGEATDSISDRYQVKHATISYDLQRKCDCVSNHVALLCLSHLLWIESPSPLISASCVRRTAAQVYSLCVCMRKVAHSNNCYVCVGTCLKLCRYNSRYLQLHALMHPVHHTQWWVILGGKHTCNLLILTLRWPAFT